MKANTIQAISNAEILTRAPAAGAFHPHASVSDRYKFVPTIEVVNMLKKEGWLPTRATETKTRKEGREGFQKHMIRFQHPELILGSEAIEAVLINSHDRSSAYQLMVGVYRFICSNGLIVGDSFNRISVKHVGFDPTEIIEASYQVIENAPMIAHNISEFKGIELSPEEQNVFAQAATLLMYDAPNQVPYSPERLLRPRRRQDSGNDLWKTYNAVQENIMKGGITGMKFDQRKRPRRTRTRPVKSIDRDVKLNKALWTLTERMAELKGQ